MFANKKGLVYIVITFENCDTGIHGYIGTQSNVVDYVNASISFNEVMYYCLNKYPNFKTVNYKGQTLFNPKLFL
jgi:hypothetical protein